jgi:hypothetical protein
MLGATMKGMRMRNIDGSDFQNFMADIGPKIKNRDILPDDVKKLLAEIDESDAFMEELRGESSSKIIPFLFGKPRKPKKADGGRVLDEILLSNVSSDEGFEKFLQEQAERDRETSLVRLRENIPGQDLSEADKLAMLLAEEEAQSKLPAFEKPIGVGGIINKDVATINYGKPVGEDMLIRGGIDYPYEADPILNIMLEKQLEDDLLLSARASKMQDQDPFFGVELKKTFKDGGAASINKATLEGIRDMPMRSRAQRIPYVQKMKSDLEKYMREGGMGSLFKEK